ncbi:MAG TPA: metal-dependent transcriptional regulator [Candidatus Eremiobacteraceae bacterium]|nr:metal-dependent transcriptional regulator [Candidatus Eremiobacteraceae bacterium]
MVNTGQDRSPERARQDYCKAILQLGDGQPVKPADVARRLGVSRASVSKLARDLQRRGYVRALGGGQLQLSAKGGKLALAVVRRHRIVETFLHQALGVPLERLHAEAERIEHVISDDVAKRLEHLLGHPQFDPHGDLIPGTGGKGRRDGPLAQAPVGRTMRITRIADRDARVVRALSRHGLLPGSDVKILNRTPRTTTLRVRGAEVTLAAAIVDAVLVERTRRE